MPQWPVRVEADGGHLLFISVGPMACQPNLMCFPACCGFSGNRHGNGPVFMSTSCGMRTI